MRNLLPSASLLILDLASTFLFLVVYLLKFAILDAICPAPFL
jgi:hypothetical protein